MILGALLLSVFATVPVQRPPNPTAQLVYTRAADASECPVEADVRAAVAARLGYNPFAAEAPNRVAVAVNRSGRGFKAEIEARDASGRVTGSRALTSRSDCAELASALALAISIAVDPLVLIRTTPNAAPPVGAAACPTCPICPAVPVPTSPVFFRAGLGGHVLVGATPGGLGAGAVARVGVRWRATSLDVEGRADPAIGSKSSPQGSVSATLLLASLVPCAHYRHAVGCVIATMGALQGTGSGTAVVRRDTTFYSAAGIRLGTELPVASDGAVMLEVHVDGLAALSRTTLRLDGNGVWTTPPLSVAPGAGLVMSF